ncbi:MULTISPECIES: hypothetical protein [Kitasatospora]|uniref:Esterase n=1 Tax=Kitasatospora setae (strain ATCC 33774 / DSM 43861 / JCM 3304 / KCC A-0304 / NBRC 14216 / KM-6054) TaxID=452652 RepID=E4NCC4_KITSK|nr:MULTISPECIES: hypothetical protein [Kitasatospora]BAJ28855.1 hypothetical protein KSE_30440 [Kitasatospora setae KM-6054]
MSRSVPPRLLAACAAAALAAGLFAAPAAQAEPGPAVTAPTVLPGTYLDGGPTDGCTATGTPGWVGAGHPGPELSARTTAPAARFKVWDGTGAKVLDTTADTDALGGVRTALTGLPDGAGYTWQVWPQDRPGSGAPTETCRFGIDTAAPTGLAVRSDDFPAQGGTAYATDTGVFAFSATDTGSGVACFRYVLDGTLGVGADCAPRQGVAAAGADGTASVALRPGSWGSHELRVEAVDHAGRVSQTVHYSFYARSNPNPPKALGDVDNDGVPDILLPDSHGNLLVISGASATATPTTVVPAIWAPIGGSWTGLQVLHKGWSLAGSPADTVYVHDLGGSYLYQYLNQGRLPLGVQSPQLVSHPSGCVDTAFNPVDCLSDLSSGFADARQLVAFGPTDPAVPNGITLLDVEQGDLWLQNDPSWFGATSTRLTTGGAWNGYDLVAPGPDAAGDLALWSREQSTGVLRAHAVPKLADGSYDFSGLADPAAGTVLGTFPAADYPVLGSSGDLDGDGRPDLYAVTADRHLIAYHGATAPQDRGPLA